MFTTFVCGVKSVDTGIVVYLLSSCVPTVTFWAGAVLFKITIHITFITTSVKYSPNAIQIHTTQYSYKLQCSKDSHIALHKKTNESLELLLENMYGCRWVKHFLYVACISTCVFAFFKDHVNNRSVNGDQIYCMLKIGGWGVHCSSCSSINVFACSFLVCINVKLFVMDPRVCTTSL